jgi:hypothetical protein
MVPNNADGFSIVVSATNASGLTTSETFAVQTPAPSPPMVTNQTGTQCCGAGEVNFTLAADTFTDPSGGTLAYAATLSNGAPLPSWLNFDPTTETFCGLMPDGTKALARSCGDGVSVNDPMFELVPDVIPAIAWPN